MLQPLAAGPPDGGCGNCGGALRKRYGRVAVRYGAWGFGSTDALVPDQRGKDFAQLRERAERISDEL
jgi:hypothetical protein